MYQRWKLAELVFTNLAIAFGTAPTFISPCNSPPTLPHRRSARVLGYFFNGKG